MRDDIIKISHKRRLRGAQKQFDPSPLLLYTYKSALSPEERHTLLGIEKVVRLLTLATATPLRAHASRLKVADAPEDHPMWERMVQDEQRHKVAKVADEVIKEALAIQQAQPEITMIIVDLEGKGVDDCMSKLRMELVPKAAAHSLRPVASSNNRQHFRVLPALPRS